MCARGRITPNVSVCLMSVTVAEINAMSEKLDVNQKLWQAVLDGNEDVVRQLLERRGDSNYRSTYNTRGSRLEWNVCCLLMEGLCKPDF